MCDGKKKKIKGKKKVEESFLKKRKEKEDVGENDYSN